MLAHLLMTHFPNWSFSLWMWNRMWRKHKEEIERSRPFDYLEYSQPLSTDRFGRYWWHDETGDMYGPYSNKKKAKRDLDRYCEAL